MTIEKTLVVLKPDSVQRGVVGEIISRFEKVGLKIVGMKMIHPDKEHYHTHYEKIGKMISRRGETPFNWTLKFMLESPVIAIVLEGSKAISVVRKMVGKTDPQNALPGTIRGDYAHMGFDRGDEIESGISNLIHASGDLNDANLEIKHWFSPSELYTYKTTHQKFM